MATHKKELIRVDLKFNCIEKLVYYTSPQQECLQSCLLAKKNNRRRSLI